MKNQFNRPHYVTEWAKKCGFEKQARLCDAIGVDKSLVSRWKGGSTPNREWQDKLSELFGCEREDLFRHPDDLWFSEFLRDKSPEEVERIKQLLEVAFPAKD